MAKKRKKLPGRVERIIKPSYPAEHEKAEIEIDGADDLYKEIRIENVVTDDKGNETQLEPGEEVDVTLETKSGSKNFKHATRKPKKS
jgi:uncharacterized cupredoxin-like copper-binding protein